MNCKRQVTHYLAGAFLGLVSAIGSAAIAVTLATQQQIPTKFVLLIQSMVALAVSTAMPLHANMLSPQVNEWTGRFRTARYRMHLLRAVAGLSIYWFYYQSFRTANKVECSLLLNTAPLFVPFLCILAFREWPPLRAWVGVVFGFAGISLVMVPRCSFATFEVGYCYALVAGMSFAVSTVLVRSLNDTEPIATTISLYNLHSVAVLLVVLLLRPEAATWHDAVICLAIGMIFCIKQYAITLSVKFASATVASVLNFATIPLLAIYAVVAEGEPVSLPTVAGTALVAVGALAVFIPSGNFQTESEPPLKGDSHRPPATRPASPDQSRKYPLRESCKGDGKANQ